MPQVQVVDTTERKPEPTGVQELFSKLGQAYKEKQENDTIGNILKEYHQNAQDANALRVANEKLASSNISPSRRLAEIENLNAIEKTITDRDKALNAQYKGVQNKQNYRAAQNTLKRLKEIQATGHLGPYASGPGKTSRKGFGPLSKEANQLRAEYSRLAKSLISFATTIPIRNRVEFETLAEGIYDVDRTNEEIKGDLDAMERIIAEGIAEQEGSQAINPNATAISINPTQPERSNATPISPTSRPPLSSFQKR